jgi:dihydroneopterin aldolase
MSSEGIERFELFLEELALEARIGVHDFELARPQRVLVDIRLELDPARLAARDELADTLDYDFLRNDILKLAASRRFQLQETLAREIVALVAARPQVLAAEVATCKPDVYRDAKSVGCRLFWRRLP